MTEEWERGFKEGYWAGVEACIRETDWTCRCDEGGSVHERWCPRAITARCSALLTRATPPTAVQPPLTDAQKLDVLVRQVSRIETAFRLFCTGRGLRGVLSLLDPLS